MTWRRSPLPPDWKKRRLTRFELDNWTCRHCGHHDPTGRTLEADHVGDHDDHRIEKLQTLCRPCHHRKTRQQIADQRRHRAQARKRPQEPHPGKQQY